MLNRVAQSACERYAMTEHFVDIKQASVVGIWTALQKYDPTVGTPFTVFQKRYISDGIQSVKVRSVAFLSHAFVVHLKQKFNK